MEAIAITPGEGSPHLMPDTRYAPGWPGIPARWTSSSKSGVGTALSSESHVWFTLSHGILNEVYYPRVDQACLRDLGLIITDGGDFFSEEKRHASHEVYCPQADVPLGRTLHLEVKTPARIRWSADGWQTVQDQETKDTGLGVYVADLPTAQLASEAVVRFTFFWPDANQWEGTDYRVGVR